MIVRPPMPARTRFLHSSAARAPMLTTSSWAPWSLSNVAANGDVHGASADRKRAQRRQVARGVLRLGLETPEPDLPVVQLDIVLGHRSGRHDGGCHRAAGANFRAKIRMTSTVLYYCYFWRCDTLRWPIANCLPRSAVVPFTNSYSVHTLPNSATRTLQHAHNLCMYTVPLAGIGPFVKSNCTVSTTSKVDPEVWKHRHLNCVGGRTRIRNHALCGSRSCQLYPLPFRVWPTLYLKNFLAVDGGRDQRQHQAAVVVWVDNPA